jgi:hypothetical protein
VDLKRKGIGGYSPWCQVTPNCPKAAKRPKSGK